MKIINLIVIFLTLAYLLPLIARYASVTSSHYYNITAGVCVYVVQFLYNLYLDYAVDKTVTNMTLKRNIIDSLLKGVMAIAAYYAYDELRKYYALDMSLNPDVQKAIIIVVLLLVFIILNSLFKP